MFDRGAHLEVLPVQVGPSGEGQGLHAVQSQAGADLLGVRAGYLVHGADAVLATPTSLDVQVVLPLSTSRHSYTSFIVNAHWAAVVIVSGRNTLNPHRLHGSPRTHPQKSFDKQAVRNKTIKIPLKPETL